jgi:hypothetical protein
VNDLPPWLIGTLPGWLTTGGVFSLVFGVAYIAAKFLPDWTRALNERRKLTIDANAAIRAEDRAKIERVETALAAMEHRLSAAEISCNAAKLRVSQLEFALRLAMDEIERAIPESVVPAQIKSLLAAAYPSDAPSGISQSDMDTYRNIGGMK